jgi:Ribosomal protein L7/L12 C-terminal domain
VDSSMIGWWVALAAFALALVMAVAGRGSRSGDVERRLTRIERRLQLVVDHLGIVEPQPSYPGVIAELDQGRKIQAIKAYREATGVGLKEAKAAVDAIARERGV